MTGFAFAYAVMHGLWRSATEKSGCALWEIICFVRSYDSLLS